MTRILWKVCPANFGLSQLVMILTDLALPAARTNNKQKKRSAGRKT